MCTCYTASLLTLGEKLTTLVRNLTNIIYGLSYSIIIYENIIKNNIFKISLKPELSDKIMNKKGLGKFQR